MHTIVGVVPHLKVYGFGETNELPQAYFPQTQVTNGQLVVLLRSSLGKQALESTVRQAVAAIDPAQPIFDVEMMRDRVEETWSTPRLMSVLLGAFSILALTLALVGLYGVMAFDGLRRAREIGIRLALGARRGQIRRMMLRQGMRLLLLGLAIGFAGAFTFSRLLRSLLFEVNAGDPASYLLVAVVLSLSAAAAC